MITILLRLFPIFVQYPLLIIANLNSSHPLLYPVRFGSFLRVPYPVTRPALVSPFLLSATMDSSNWQTLCAERKKQQLESIPKEWTIQLPPASQGNVLDIPETCGLLSQRELEITNTTDVDILLGKLALGQWSSVEVITAFYKRAIIAQQLVSTALNTLSSMEVLRQWPLDELPYRDIY